MLQRLRRVAELGFEDPSTGINLPLLSDFDTLPSSLAALVDTVFGLVSVTTAAAFIIKRLAAAGYCRSSR
jgi:hypothetical protein